MTNQQPKIPREWWIQLGTPDMIADSFQEVESFCTGHRSELPVYHVIEHAHHVAEVARLEADCAKMANLLAQAAADRDAWKSCAVNLAEGLRWYIENCNVEGFETAGGDGAPVGTFSINENWYRAKDLLKHFDGMEGK